MTKSNRNINYETIAKFLATALIALVIYFGQAFDRRLTSIEKEISQIKVSIAKSVTDAENVENQRYFSRKK